MVIRSEIAGNVGIEVEDVESRAGIVTLRFTLIKNVATVGVPEVANHISFVSWEVSGSE
jgi:hypothetical protein